MARCEVRKCTDLKIGNSNQERACPHMRQVCNWSGVMSEPLPSAIFTAKYVLPHTM